MIPSRSPIYIAGQTGSGKTAVSVALASHLGESEILSADAFQVYEGMEILSAAPTPEEQGGVHHHFVSCRSPALGWDAATFADEARNQLADLAARAPTATPIVVGGSGLYLKALTHGLAPTPKGDPALRAELDALSLEQLVERYRDIDPDGAAETNLKNRRYVTRNLEISLLSGEPASALK
ncbi:MAG: isopentenyl transferase family protein, partial [Planctomycetota bacterium]